MFLIVTYLPVSVGCILFHYLPESPYWLANKKKYKETFKSYNFIFKVNQQDKLTQVEKRKIQQLNPVEEESNMLVLLKKEYLKATILLSFIWFAHGFVYFAIVFMLPRVFIEDMSANSLTNTFLAILGEAIFSNILALAFIITIWFGRLQSSLVCMIVVSAGLFFCSYLSYELWFLIHLTIALTALGAVFVIIEIYCFEIYPTNIRGIGGSVTTSFYFVGGIIVPFLCTSLEKIDSHLCFFACFVINVAATISILGLEVETKDKPLDTMHKKNEELK